MLWIIEVEMAKSMDDLMSSQSIGGYRFPNFEMLDAKLACALKKIIPNPYFKRRGAKSSNTGPISSRKTDCSYDLRTLPSYWRS